MLCLNPPTNKLDLTILLAYLLSATQLMWWTCSWRRKVASSSVMRYENIFFRTWNMIQKGCDYQSLLRDSVYLNSTRWIGGLDSSWGLPMISPAFENRYIWQSEECEVSLGERSIKRKYNAKIVPHALTAEQKEIRTRIANAHKLPYIHPISLRLIYSAVYTWRYVSNAELWYTSEMHFIRRFTWLFPNIQKH